MCTTPRDGWIGIAQRASRLRNEKGNSLLLRFMLRCFFLDELGTDRIHNDVPRSALSCSMFYLLIYSSSDPVAKTPT